ncbi:LytR/AlgR family response regulator transcription factor [Polaribacter sp.]|uniref:LytR/AlgR family response regulator transcription factor n=1 Tax=Polaribacter sp. TaxID=1920175 RepID=UPI003EF633E6
MISSIIIENDKNTTANIKAIALEFPEIYFLESSENQDAALNAVLKNNAEIIIINIDSPTFNIAEFMLEVQNYTKRPPTFVAMSAFKEKAYDAYKYNFTDFILKPLTELSIRKSILKVLKKNEPSIQTTICLKSNKDYRYLDIDKILYLKADNNTTDFFMSDGSVVVVYKTLKVFENTLPKNFLRIHKSYIINKDCISRIHYGKSVCILNNQHKIPFTKTFIDNMDLINTSLSKNTIITLN